MTAVIASTFWGPMLVPPYDTYVGQALIRLRAYCHAEFETWAPYIPVGGVVIDAGANIGAHTLPFALQVGPTGTVFAIEPQRMLHHMICGSLALNNIRHVRVKHCALSRVAETVYIPPLDYAAQNNFGALEARFAKEGEGEAVAAVPLDGFGIKRCDFLKIDVEGMELDVLHGAKETIAACRPVMSVEADREKNIPATLNWLRLNGYRAWWHRPLLGPLWPRVVSVNLLCLPREREDLPEPRGDVEAVIE